MLARVCSTWLARIDIAALWPSATTFGRMRNAWVFTRSRPENQAKNSICAIFTQTSVAASKKISTHYAHPDAF
ncbi:hypothetical protein A6456_20435 [Paraburkholderia tropica]|nr:hypothetical protein A6456_20435 [Paraburkholderia tropica]